MLAPINSFNNHKKVNFTSNARVYKLPSGQQIKCYTSFFRGDLSWDRFTDFLIKNFKHKDKVNVLNSACSDGSEAYSLIMAFKEKFSPSQYEKFFPIKASDYDEEIVRAAKSGLILVQCNQIPKIDLYVSSHSDYFERSFDKTLVIKDDKTVNLLKTLKVKDTLLNDVEFEQIGVFNLLKKLDDKSNTVLMFRNALGHLKDDAAKKFAKLVGEKLQPGSVVVIGSFDKNCTNIDKYLKEAGFTEVLQNVFRKNNPNPSLKDRITLLLRSLIYA